MSTALTALPGFVAWPVLLRAALVAGGGRVTGPVRPEGVE